MWPDSVVAGCTGAGQITGVEVHDGLSVTAISFDKARVASVAVDIADASESEAAGRRLIDLLPHEGLRHVLVLSDGLHVNGTDLVGGMQEKLPSGVAVTGGLAGDGDRFEQTMVAHGADVRSNQIVAVGFYGELHIGFGSMGGWDPFGPQRKVTRADGNVLYELDGRPALELYKEYLGEHASGLPATGLLFPLHIQDAGGGLVRTILAVDDAAQTLTFAGDVPEGTTAQLMKANFDRLVDGASGAATASVIDGASFAFLVSCVGRRLVLKQRTEDELEAVQEATGRQAVLAGFYSYGEICPSAPGADCRLHNQTMTITTFSEP